MMRLIFIFYKCAGRGARFSRDVVLEAYFRYGADMHVTYKDRSAMREIVKFPFEMLRYTSSVVLEQIEARKKWRSHMVDLAMTACAERTPQAAKSKGKKQI